MAGLGGRERRRLPRPAGRRTKARSGVVVQTLWARAAMSGWRAKAVRIARDERSSPGAARMGFRGSAAGAAGAPGAPPRTCPTISAGGAPSKPGAIKPSRKPGSRAQSETAHINRYRYRGQKFFPAESARPAPQATRFRVQPPLRPRGPMNTNT